MRTVSERSLFVLKMQRAGCFSQCSGLPVVSGWLSLGKSDILYFGHRQIHVAVPVILAFVPCADIFGKF